MSFLGFLTFRIVRIIGRLCLLFGVGAAIVATENQGFAFLIIFIGFAIEMYGVFKSRSRIVERGMKDSRT